MAYRWTIAEGTEHHLPRGLLEDPEGFISERGKILSNGRRHLSALCEVGHVELFVKVYRLSPLERVKSLFKPCRAEREWRGARRLYVRGVPVPKPIAWGKGKERACYICCALKGRPLLEAVAVDDNDELLREVARTVKAMHDAGVFHRDLHAHNLIIAGGKPHIIDLHRHRLSPTGTVPRRERLWDMACLLYSLREHLSEGDRETFLKAYGGVDPFELQAAERRVRQRHLQHVRQDCLRDSADFKRVALGQLQGWARRELSEDKLRTILAKHEEIVHTRGTGLKKISHRSAVTLFYIGDERFCVKEYYYKGLSSLKELFRLPKPRRAWINANLLKAMGVGALIPVAYVENSAKVTFNRAYLVVLSPSRYIELPQYIKTLWANFQKKRRFIINFATFLSSMKNVYTIWHRDLKAWHILVAETDTAWDYALIEPEDITFATPTKRKILHNLIQLNKSVPSFVTWQEKYRFLKLYLKDNCKHVFKIVSKF